MNGQEDPTIEETRLRAWMIQAQAGDSVAYRSLLSELGRMLERFTARAVRRSGPNQDEALARDIVQETLLAIHEKRHTYDPAQRFLPWVYGIARHKLVDWQRKRFSEARWVDLSFDLETAAAPEDSEDHGDLVALMNELHPPYRVVLELTKFEGRSVAEAAKEMGTSEANIKVLTHRAIRALKKLLEAKHE